MTVHNHGPAEGPGLDCPERETQIGLRGACLPTYVEIELVDGPLDGQMMSVDESMGTIVLLTAPQRPFWTKDEDPPRAIEPGRLIYRARDTWNPRTRMRQYVLD